MFKSIQQSDIVVRPFPVYKRWEFDETTIPISFGEDTNTSFDPITDEQTNGIYKKPLYRSIKSQFYTNSSTSSPFTEVGFRRSYASTDERVIENEVAVISIPPDVYGEGIRRESLTLTSSSLELTDDGFSNLVSGSEIYGNVFYDRGLIVLTKDITSGSSWAEYDIQFQSTFTIYENEIFLEVQPGEFNLSQNPTAIEVQYDDEFIWETTPKRTGLPSGSVLIKPIISANRRESFISNIDPSKSGSFDDYETLGKSDPTGSFLTPYITTVGLYDDNNQMVATAKLPTPIKSLPDYPINFIIRFDT
jgi:hypothetical protein